MQSVPGNPLESVGVRDNVDIPFRDPKTKTPGEVWVKIPFTNPLIVGQFPYYCHILEREDGRHDGQSARYRCALKRALAAVLSPAGRRHFGRAGSGSRLAVFDVDGAINETDTGS